LAVWPYIGREQKANAEMTSKLRRAEAQMFHMGSSYACAATVVGKVN
jgi:hypothetical protein